MFRKLVTSFNWVVGTVALVAALFSGFLKQTGGVDTHKVAIKRYVQDIAKLEGGKRDLGGFVTFPRDIDEMERRLGTKLGTNDYRFEAFYEENKKGGRDFVIRATVADNVVRSGGIPPLIYRHVIPADGSAPRGEWVQLSGKKYGLDLF